MVTENSDVAVVLGAAGVVGSGVVRKFLDAGSTVVGVSRSAERLADLRRLLEIRDDEPFLAVVGDFSDEESAAAAKRDVEAALAGRPIDHVVSVQGFSPFAQPPTATPLATVKEALDDGFYNNFLAAKVFLPALKSRAGSSFTLVSGGLAHFPPPNPKLWLLTIKNAAVNALTYALTAETASDAVRVNTVCIHFSVAAIGGDKNQLGVPSEGNTLRLAPAFVAIARGTQKGKVLCLNSFAEAEALGA